LTGLEILQLPAHYLSVKCGIIRPTVNILHCSAFVLKIKEQNAGENDKKNTMSNV